MRKRHEEGDGSLESGKQGMMNFTMLTKRGNKQQVRQLAIPSESALAVQTRSAQEQDKVEQQHLKRLVLDYEQREEAEEIKGGLAFTFLICQTGTLGQRSKPSPDLSRFASPDSPYTCLKMPYRSANCLHPWYMPRSRSIVALRNVGTCKAPYYRGRCSIELKQTKHPNGSANPCICTTCL